MTDCCLPCLAASDWGLGKTVSLRRKHGPDVWSAIKEFHLAGSRFAARNCSIRICLEVHFPDARHAASNVTIPNVGMCGMFG